MSIAMSPINRLKGIARKLFSPNASFRDLSRRKRIFLYAGDIPQDLNYNKYVGLSCTQSNSRHVRHDLTEALPLPDNCVDIYQSEDVFEHIDPRELPSVINEIYRVLKPGGLFRLSLPDYRCNILHERSLKDEHGNLVFDPEGGGDYIDGRVVNGGHVWFPTYETVRDLLGSTLFTNISYYHYYDEKGNGVTHAIDYSLGHVRRTPDHDERVQDPYRPLSIVVDCRK
jgi:SAM-dependent methyltransferase